jgi:hypothetical protein
LKQQGAGALRPPKLDFAVFDDGAQEGDGADTTSLLTLPVLQKPQAASFAIFSDFDDNPPASSTAQATGGGGGGKRQPAGTPLLRSLSRWFCFGHTHTLGMCIIPLLCTPDRDGGA